MKTLFRLNSLSILLTALLIFGACSKSDDPKPNVPNPPNKLPEIPPSPNPPSGLSTVADIRAGKYNKGDEVYLYGHLTKLKNSEGDEWFFTDDGTNEIILDFPTSQVPAVGKKMLVYGGVDDIGEVDVISWQETETKPTDPKVPTFPPAGVNPPDLKITTVDDIVKDKVRGEVIMAGQLTNQQDDDCDEWVFNDGTGSIEVEFASCNVPAIGTPVYIYGKTDGRFEVDVFSWIPQ